LEATRAWEHLGEVYYFSDEVLRALGAILQTVNLAGSAEPTAELARGHADMAVTAGFILFDEAARRGGDLQAQAQASLCRAQSLLELGRVDEGVESAQQGTAAVTCCQPSQAWPARAWGHDSAAAVALAMPHDKHLVDRELAHHS
jgi:hypothetical protein